MEKTYIGSLVGTNLKIGIVAGRFNDFITEQLLSGALSTLKQHEVKAENIEVAWVPGAFEIPLIAETMAKKDDYDAIITLGAVIRGATPHFDYVCGEAASGIAHASRATNKPVIFGILTTETLEQAIERAGTKAGNKGSDSARAAIEMANLQKELTK